MKFVFDEERVFNIEEERFYKKTEFVKVCDFVSLKEIKSDTKLCFIEAKKSAPNQSGDYVNKVHDQFCHGLFLYIGAIFNRHGPPPANMSDSMKERSNLELPVG